MVIKLRWKQKRNSAPNVIEIPRRPGESEAERVVTAEEMARGLAALLWPASTVPLALAVWRMGQDLGFASEFFLQDGLASRWQVWLATGIFMMAAARHLDRWKPAPKSSERLLEPAAVEIVREQPDGHPRRRFGNLR